MPSAAPNWGELACGTDEEVRTCSKHLTDKLLNKLKADGHDQVVDRFVQARKENGRLNPSRSGAETVARVRKEFAEAKRDVYKALAGTLIERSSVSGDRQQADFDRTMAERANQGTGRLLRDTEHLLLCAIHSVKEAQRNQLRTGGYLKEGRDGNNGGVLQGDLRRLGQEEGDDDQDELMPQYVASTPALASSSASGGPQLVGHKRKREEQAEARQQQHEAVQPACIPIMPIQHSDQQHRIPCSLSTHGPLLVGHDCAGVDAPRWALRNLGVGRPVFLGYRH